MIWQGLLETVIYLVCAFVLFWIGKLVYDLTTPAYRIKEELGWSSRVPIEQGVQNMLKVIDYWRDAPVWTPDTIAEATKDWFTYLGRS